MASPTEFRDPIGAKLHLIPSKQHHTSVYYRFFTRCDTLNDCVVRSFSKKQKMRIESRDIFNSGSSYWNLPCAVIPNMLHFPLPGNKITHFLSHGNSAPNLENVLHRYFIFGPSINEFLTKAMKLWIAFIYRNFDRTILLPNGTSNE